MILDTLTLEDVELVRQWRNQDLKVLRTPYMLTKEMQREFYDMQVCNRNANSRWWAIKESHTGTSVEDKDLISGYILIGMGGLENIVWENRNAEISLIIDPDLRGKGYGEKALGMILKMGFNYLGLHTIDAEVYWCNPDGQMFWLKMAEKHPSRQVILADRKYWDGKYYDSDFITFFAPEENNG